jgi:hypothetical protein
VQRRDAMYGRHDDMRWAAAGGDVDRLSFVARLGQTIVALPAVGSHHGAGTNDIADEAHVARSANVRDPSEANTPVSLGFVHRQWCRKFGPAYARAAKRRTGRLGDNWYLDEVFVTIKGRRHYLWRAVDQDGDTLDILVQYRRNQRYPGYSGAVQAQPARRGTLLPQVAERGGRLPASTGH